MNDVNQCVFCHPEVIKSQIIKIGEHSVSLVPKHSFRTNHVMVIPRRHVLEVGELSAEEAAEILLESGRLAKHIDAGYGSGVMQKYQPTQAENGIKMNHIHFHIFPRIANEQVLFPVPVPNSFDGLRETDAVTMKQLVERLQ